MRICMEFEIKYNRLNSDYRKYFISWIKRMLTMCNEGKYFKNYYNDTKTKPFSFAVAFNKPRFSKDYVIFEDNKIKMYFSVTDENRTGLILCNGFLKMKGIPFKLSENNEMKLVSVRRLNEKLIMSDRALFKTLSGSSVVVRDHNRKTNKDKYFTVEDENYINELEKNIKVQCEKAGYTLEDIKKIKVNEVNGRKIVSKNYDVYIDSVSGVFDISATSEILQYLYTVGLGSKRSAGYGTIDLV